MQDNKFTFSSFIEITKLRLSVSVVFSSVISYLIGMSEFDFETFIYLVFGGLMMVSASNIFNQIIERDLDALMQRTKGRPLPMGQISVNNALVLGFVFVISGLTFLYIISPLCAMLGAISIFIYACVYTPLKLITPLSVFVGAIPGAIPFMLGWVAATNELGVEALALFLMQFFWQFPHFWALAWKLDEDYKKAGFRLLPSGDRNQKSAFQIMLYSAFLVPVSMLPWASEMTGTWSMWSAVVISLIMYYPAVKLYFTLDKKYATQLMFMSFLYLPILFTMYCFNQI